MELEDLENTSAFRAGKEAADYLKVLAAESERAAVVMGAARVEVALEHMLKAVMRPASGTNDELFDPDQPIGTLSAKIRLAFRLGIIDDDFSRRLHVLRRMRNDFAHSTQPETLDRAPHKDRLHELAKGAEPKAMWKLIEKHLRPTNISANLGTFVIMTTIIVALLEAGANEISTPKHAYVASLDQAI